MSAATPLSSGGASVFLIVGKFWACVSQPRGPAPRSLNVTNETPASTSRRASRHDWPTVVRPYFSRTAADSSFIRNADWAALEVNSEYARSANWSRLDVSGVPGTSWAKSSSFLTISRRRRSRSSVSRSGGVRFCTRKLS